MGGGPVILFILYSPMIGNVPPCYVRKELCIISAKADQPIIAVIADASILFGAQSNLDVIQLRRSLFASEANDYDQG